jgi:hypothetical protein
MSRTLFVNQKRVPINAAPADGTIQNPFPTIQAAVNFAATLKPAITSPVAIAIMQGTYRENVLIDIDGIVLRGLGGVGTVRIQPTTGSAVTITNCTPASVKSFAVSKNASLLKDNAKTVAPAKVELVDLALESAEAGVPTICIAGFPKRPPLGKAPQAAITLSNCLVHHADANGKALLAYFAEYIRVRHNCEITAPTEIFNCLGFLVDDTDVQNFMLDFDPAAAPAPAGFELGLVGNNASFLGETAELRGSGGDPLQPTLNTTFFDLVLRETATFSMVGGCANSVTTEGGASWMAEDVYVRGNLNIATGSGQVTMNAGRYMGTLTDPSAKLVRNLGQ